MNRKLSILAMLLFLAYTGTAHARIKIVEKPGVAYDSWTSSWGLRMNRPNEYPMGTASHKTKAEAIAAAKKHMAKTRGNGSYAVTHYLIEGVPSTRGKATKRVKQAKDVLTRLREAKDAVDHAKKYYKGEASIIRIVQRKLGDVVREYGENIERALGRIAETKTTLTGGVAAGTDAQFRKVNDLIDQYNRDVQGYQRVMGRRPSFRHNGQWVVARPLEHLPRVRTTRDVNPLPKKEPDAPKDDAAPYTTWQWTTNTPRTGKRGPISTYKDLNTALYFYKKLKEQERKSQAEFRLDRYLPPILKDRHGNVVAE